MSVQTIVIRGNPVHAAGLIERCGRAGFSVIHLADSDEHPADALQNADLVWVLLEGEELPDESARLDDQSAHSLSQLEQHMTPGAILAASAPSDSCWALARSLTRPAQFLGVRLASPQRLELIPISETAPGVLEATRLFGRQIGLDATNTPAPSPTCLLPDAAE